LERDRAAGLLEDNGAALCVAVRASQLIDH
jgi:hypothetical protein